MNSQFEDLDLSQLGSTFVLNSHGMTTLELMLRKRATRDGSLWGKLSKEEMAELLAANEESENIDNLIPHDEMKIKYAKWV